MAAWRTCLHLSVSNGADGWRTNATRRIQVPNITVNMLSGFAMARCIRASASLFQGDSVGRCCESTAKSQREVFAQGEANNERGRARERQATSVDKNANTFSADCSESVAAEQREEERKRGEANLRFVCPIVVYELCCLVLCFAMPSCSLLCACQLTAT